MVLSLTQVRALFGVPSSGNASGSAAEAIPALRRATTAGEEANQAALDVIDSGLKTLDLRCRYLDLPRPIFSREIPEAVPVAVSDLAEHVVGIVAADVFELIA